MTRLIRQDIERISHGLVEYDRQLIASTGCGMLEIACRCSKVVVDEFKQRAAAFKVRVIPVTAGLGVISGFADSVVAILNHLGIPATGSPASDVAGLAVAMEDGVDGIFMSDDTRFMGMDCNRKKIVDNSAATGRIYATALGLLAGGLTGKKVLVAGCGPVGRSAAQGLLKLGGGLTLVDTDMNKAEALRAQLRGAGAMNGDESPPITVEPNIDRALMAHDYILDATPDKHLVSDGYLTKDKMIAIPGVPPGLSKYGFDFLGRRVIHDKLELGVAGMAVELLL